MGNDNPIKIILFDLGGVLLKLNDPAETFGLEGSDIEFKERWLRSPSVRTFESGKIDTEEFAKRVVSEADLPYDWQEFIERFDSWPGQLYDETIGVLDAIPKEYSRALLSNINALHWGRDEIAGRLAGYLDRTFLSFETGLVKPDREAFELVTGTYKCRPEEVLFLDDTPSSISAAADYGIDAVHTVGITAVRETLAKRGVLR
jgi:putative hydrolase of the HAD superfamily